MKDTLWGTRNRKIISSVVAALLALTVVGLLTETDDNSDTADVDGPLMPAVKEGASEDEPYWATTFTVRLPAGHWEPFDDDECSAIGGRDGVWFETSGGETVELYDHGTSVTLDSTNDIDGDTCLVDGVVLADYANIADTYILYVGELTATFTDVELYQGQGAGQNAVVPAG